MAFAGDKGLGSPEAISDARAPIIWDGELLVPLLPEIGNSIFIIHRAADSLP